MHFKSLHFHSFIHSRYDFSPACANIFAIPERLKGVITTRRYTNPRLPLPSSSKVEDWFRVPNT